MRLLHQVPTVAGILFFAASLLFAQIAPNETSYLDHVATLAPTSEVKQDEVISFEADVTDDGSPEVFYTKASLRDGKHGYLWSVFEKQPAGSIRPIGDVTFSIEVFSPATWKGDEKAKGFYTYFPSGGSRGSLGFFEVTPLGVTRRESRKIEPSGSDKAEFDTLFANRLTGEGPKFELKRTPLNFQKSTNSPNDKEGVPSAGEKEAHATKPLTEVAPAASKATDAKPDAVTAGRTTSTSWRIIVVSLIVACFLGYLLSKWRSKTL